MRGMMLRTEIAFSLNVACEEGFNKNFDRLHSELLLDSSMVQLVKARMGRRCHPDAGPTEL